MDSESHAVIFRIHWLVTERAAPLPLAQRPLLTWYKSSLKSTLSQQHAFAVSDMFGLSASARNIKRQVF